MHVSNQVCLWHRLLAAIIVFRRFNEAVKRTPLRQGTHLHVPSHDSGLSMLTLSWRYCTCIYRIAGNFRGTHEILEIALKFRDPNIPHLTWLGTWG